jgi:hypothetical protein
MEGKGKEEKMMMKQEQNSSKVTLPVFFLINALFTVLISVIT